MTSLPLVSLKRCIASALKISLGIIHQSWRIPSSIFVLGSTLHTSSSLSCTFWKHQRSTATTSSHFLPTSQSDHQARSIEKRFGESCGSAVLTGAGYWSSSHCIPAQKLCLFRQSKITTVHREGLTSTWVYRHYYS